MEKDNKNVDITIKKIFLQVFQNLDEKEFGFNKRQEEFEDWDSLAHIEIISKIESNFNISLGLNETLGLNTPGNFADLVKNKLNLKQ